MNPHEMARRTAPRLFAIVEQYDDPKDVRVAGYGLAYGNRADVNSVEGDFRLTSDSPDHARTVFEISSRSAGARRAHVIWLDSPQPHHNGS